VVFSFWSVPRLLSEEEEVQSGSMFLGMFELCLGLYPQGTNIVGTGNDTPEVPEILSAWGYSWATLSPGVINTEKSNAGEGQ
jgi:hypothetical protein